MAAHNFVDYFFRRINGVKRVQFDSHLERTSGEGTYLFANGLPIGMATPGDCQGIKMEFDYGVTPTLTTGKMAHGLDIKMTMDQAWDTDTKPYNCTVRGARIQAWSEDNIAGRLTGAYINARAEGTDKEIEGYISGATGPGIIGIQARTELGTSATITSPAAVGVMIYHHSKGSAVLTGGYRALQIEVPLLLAGASISSTTYGIYIADEWGGGDDFDCGMCLDDDICTTGIQIGNCTTGITLDGTMTTGLNIATGCTTGIAVVATTGISIGAGTTSINFAGAATNCMVVTTVPTGTDGGILKAGVQATHLEAASAGGQLHLFVDNSQVASGSNRVVRVETLSSGTSTALKNFGGRFAAGIKTGKTAVSGAWCIGLQGKVVSAGTTVDGNTCAAILAQLNNSGTFGTGTNLYGMWIDNQLATTPTCGGSGGNFWMLGITNTCAACVPTGFIQVYGTSHSLFDMTHTGNSWVHDTATVSSQQGRIRVVLGGVDMYIPLYTTSTVA